MLYHNLLRSLREDHLGSELDFMSDLRYILTQKIDYLINMWKDKNYKAFLLIKRMIAMEVELKLLPRLVPSPLWNISLANLSKMDPRLARLWTDIKGIEEYINKLSTWWRSLEREGKCEICGVNKAKEIDEVWEYKISEEKGLARLTGLKLVCDKCHLAIHLGYASVIGKLQEALHWLVQVSNVTLSEARTIKSEVFKNGISSVVLTSGHLTYLC